LPARTRFSQTRADRSIFARNCSPASSSCVISGYTGNRGLPVFGGDGRFARERIRARARNVTWSVEDDFAI
jgi:hypothetical protein